MTRPRHLLIIGGGMDLPRRVHSVQPELRTSMICRREVLAGVEEPERMERLIALRADAPVGEWVAAAEYVHRIAPVDRVFNFTEKDIDKTAAIGAALGLPTVPAETYRLVADKVEMRRRLAHTGVDDTEACLVRTRADIAEFGARVGYPLICKPVRGVGSRGVARIDTPGAIDDALAWGRVALTGLPQQDLMVERFHTGAEFSVECLSEAGRHVVACITKKITESEHFVEVGHILPAPLDGADSARIAGTVTAMLDALGVENGVTHTEVVDAGDTVRVIETHLRPAGDEIPYMLRKARGVDLIDALARQGAGLPALDRVVMELSCSDPDRYAAIWYVCPDVHGELREVGGAARAREMPGVCDVSILRKVGERLDGVSSSAARVAHVWAVGPTPEEALARARGAAEHLTFHVVPAAVR